MTRHAFSGPPPSGAGRVVAGRYRLLRPLGNGGAGGVWLAHDQLLDREVALRAGRGQARRAAGPRDHPHAVPVYDVAEHEGVPWIVMEYLADAVDLRELVARHGPAAPADCARIGLAVLDALAAGHERGVPYREVDPADVLLAPDSTGAPYGRILLAAHGLCVRPDGAAGPEAELHALGRMLYYGVEGREPFDGVQGPAGCEVPRPPVRAGALRPLLDRLLAGDPALRGSVAEAGAELAWIVTPQTEVYVRPRTDPGSQPPWAAAPGFPPGPAVPADQHTVATATPAVVATAAPVGPVGPAPSVPGGHRRSRPRALRAAFAGGLGLVLALGGVWYALADRAADGTGAPYGNAVGLVAPLEDGDCVRAHWPGGTRFTGTPRLTVDPACRGGAPDGQVMAFVPASSAEEARELGAARCEERTQEVRARLADVRSLAVVPADDGFETAGRRTACLVLGARGPVHGPLDRHREPGSVFADTATMQRRDCLDVRAAREVRLVSCAGRYDEQVLGFARLAPGVTLAEAPAEADAACAREVPPRDYGFDPSLHEAGSRTAPGAWKSGSHLVVCTVRRQNGGTMEGN
ncbi:septum formation family protein [Streptomyces lancefieldiae]|uniref:non-specific serine/threonine protein kinase n=1 Tax=Streptomyces lancefieldiae TaxID=3075520 RepID=A0ABU3AL45_9ACTN|nr:septum formation family protein [Streptomyces sp. DSM 40712]MDT0610914.1 septum formation family protein [Streptomyces sp. DSM 40712]